MKRIITLLLTLAMTFSLAMPAQAASTKASTMRLMDTVGTATVENAAGKNLSIKDNMRLYNGYEVATKDASYAYISLDSSKAVKLDASSAVKVNQSGKKLELDVTAGELMFNVPVALKSDESLNIRTSTMVTGIRGTAGWVNALDRYTTRVAVLEGAVTINSQDPFTGADRSVTIVGGQIATIIRHERANAIQQQLIDDGVIIEENIVAELTEPGQIVEEIQEADIPGFVAEEVSSNSDLQDRISEESPLNVDEIIQDAEERLKKEEQAAEKQNDLIEKELKELSATNPGLPFTTPEVIIQTNTVTNTVTNTETKYLDMDNPSAADVKSAFLQLDVVSVTNANFDLKDIAKIQAGKTLYIASGTLKNSGTANIEGTMILLPGASMNNTGSLSVDSANSLHIYGAMTNANRGNIVLGGTSKAGRLVVEQGGRFINYGNISIANANSQFVVIGNYQDYVNEVMAQTATGTVIYLGSFENIAPNQYNGRTFKVLNAGTLTTNNTLLFPESAHITLDMNGNEADLVNNSDSVDEVNCLVVEMQYEPRIRNEEEEEYNSSHLTLMDSVGGGKLSGYIEVSDGAELRLKSGTLVVPEEKTGISLFAYSNFVMTGGTIDARADGAIAFDLGDNWRENGYDSSLRGGIIIGTPTRYGAYYCYEAPGEGNPLPIVRVDGGGDSDSGSDAELTEEDGYDAGMADGEADTYYLGWHDGYGDASNGYVLEANYDYTYSDKLDAAFNSGYSDCPDAEGTYGFGYYVGYLEGCAYGYSRGYYEGYEKHCRENGTGDYADGTYADGYNNGYSDGRFDAQDDTPDDSNVFGTHIAFNIRFYRIDSRNRYAPFYLCSAVYDSEAEESISYIDLGVSFIVPQA